MLDARGRDMAWLIGSLLLVASCTTALHPVPIEVVQSGREQTYKRVLLVTRDGYERRLTDVVVRSDSLVGTRTDSTGQRLAVTVSGIVRLESEEADIRLALDAVAGVAGDILVGIAQALALLARCLLLKCG